METFLFQLLSTQTEGRWGRSRSSTTITRWHYKCFQSLILVFASGHAAAQTTTDQHKAETDACRSEVARFEQVIGYLRQTQGNKAAAEIKERLLPAHIENDLLMSKGYCGVAAHLRDKRLTR